MVEELPSICVGRTQTRITQIFAILFPIGLRGQHAALEHVDGTHHQHFGLDSIGVSDHNLLNFVDRVVKVAVAHHEIDVVAFIVVVGTSHKVSEADVVIPAQGQR